MCGIDLLIHSIDDVVRIAHVAGIPSQFAAAWCRLPAGGNALARVVLAAHFVGAELPGGTVKLLRQLLQRLGRPTDTFDMAAAPAIGLGDSLRDLDEFLGQAELLL